MKEKKLIIEAIKSLDFDALQNILDDNRSYMNVSKDLFLLTLKQHLDEYAELKSFEKVIEGICNYCNKGCKAYKFKSENSPSLSLYFEEKDGKVTDIYLCHSLKDDTAVEGERTIDFSFYEEESVNFIPTDDYLWKVHTINKAVEQFNNMPSIGIVPVEHLVHWYDEYNNLANEIQINNPFNVIRYKAYTRINALYQKVSDLVYNYKNVDLARRALDMYRDIDFGNEKNVVQWLLENDFYKFYLPKESYNWEKTGIIILDTNPQLRVDCRICLDSFFLSKNYSTLLYGIMEKYKPTEEHYKNNGGAIEYSLETYLTLLNKYPDLIEKKRKAFFCSYMTNIINSPDNTFPF